MLSACGGGGSGASGAPSGLVLLTFLQDGLDDVALNTRLEFRFGAELDADSVSPGTVQIRAGGGAGRPAAGTFEVDGAVLRFVPDLPALCDGSDGGLLPETNYAVTLVGSPTEPALAGMDGRPLGETTSLSFGTGAAVDPTLFDLPPGEPPSLRVVQAIPADGSEAVRVAAGNRIVLHLSGKVHPCSVVAAAVRLRIAQRGDITAFEPAADGSGNASGFVTSDGDTRDQAPADPYSWGDAAALPNVTTLPTAQTIPTRVQLVQDYENSEIHVTPDFGSNGARRFPENALLVLEVTAPIEGYDGNPIAPFTLAFTTENLPAQQVEYVLENEGETLYDTASTTADVDSARAPGRIQGFLLFAGDGDNGEEHLTPSRPQSDADCLEPYQADDGTLDDFDPGADVLLDTGTSANTCPNGVDGSLAVVWEFQSLRIRDGVTVRVVGRNPAILLVRGDVRIDAGGRLLVRGDGLGGAPQGAGEGNQAATTNATTTGGVGVAGGGDGGSSYPGLGTFAPPRVGGHGEQGYYHTADGSLGADVGRPGGPGGGHGNISARWNEQSNPNNRNTPSGGGGGHAAAGGAGTALGVGDLPTSLDGPVDGAGGGTYGDAAGRMPRAEAGSGGGAGGELRPFTTNIGRGPGGAGGAGGGFLDITCTGTLSILGTLDAAGSDGGSNDTGGAFNPSYGWNPGTGGGGGGSGGGLRLLTPGDIVLGASTVITAAGGKGGVGGLSHGVSPARNDGGDGGPGRIVLEDGNSIVAGLAAAAVTPGEGSPGFRRAPFDGTRFRRGGLLSRGVTQAFFAGAFDPVFVAPQQDYAGAQDFVAGLTSDNGNGVGTTALLIEARGFEILPNGAPDLGGALAAPTAWHTIGFFTDSGTDTQPTWNLGQPPLEEIGGALPEGNDGRAGIAHLDGREFLQLRFTLVLRDGVDASAPGPWLDRWVIRATTDH